MRDEHDDKPEQITVVPSLVFFGVSTVITFVVMFLTMIYNANGGF